MPRRILAHALALAAALLAPAALRAQSLAGQVVESSSHAPVAGHWVRLVRHGADGAAVIDSARTDARGLFQLLPPEPGVYQLVMGGGDWVEFRAPLDTLAADSAPERMYELQRAPDQRVYFEFEVTKPVVALGGASPRYPETLREQHIAGEVLMQWIVDENGMMVPGSVHVLKTTDVLFTQAVIEALPRMRFLPAERNGRKVRQIVQQPFQFALQW